MHPILYDHQASGNTSCEDLTATAAVRFTSSWIEAVDSFLAAGFCSPSEFVEAVRELDVRPDDMPDDLRRRIFIMLRVAADVGITDLQVSVDDTLDLFDPAEHDEVRHVAFAEGVATNIKLFAGWTKEHALRVQLYRRSREALTGLQPIGDVVRELLQGMTS